MRVKGMSGEAFITSDGDLAAYLYSRGYRLLSTCGTGVLIAYVFSHEAAVSAEAYYAGASVPAKNLLHAARQLWRSEQNGPAIA